jgi:hypothetical protein
VEMGREQMRGGRKIPARHPTNKHGAAAERRVRGIPAPGPATRRRD